MSEKTKIKDLAYWRANCEDDYMKTPISVLRYIIELENEIAEHPSPALQDAVKEIAFPSESDVKSYLATLPYYGTCTTEYNEGFEDGVKWTREKCINELNS